MHRLRRDLPQPGKTIALIVFILLLACGGAGAFLAAPDAAAALTGPSATVDAGGLVLTLRIAPGPYFLRELLPVGVSLANHTNATVHVPHGGCGGGMSGVSEGGVFSVTEAGGSAPTFQLPVAQVPFSCPGPLGADDLAPGQTRAANDLLLPLTASGQVTLTGRVAMTGVARLVGRGISYRGLDPFEGHEPALALTVAPRPPQDRTLNLWQHTTRIIVLGPPGALLHLVYRYTASCRSGMTGVFGWVPLRFPVLDEQPCADNGGTWNYALGAPGYAITTDTATFS